MSQEYSDAKSSFAELCEVLRHESQEGRAVLSSPYENPICSIGVDESVPCLRVSWKSYATSAQLRFILEHVLQMLKRHNLTRILGDDAAIPVIHSEDQVWIANNWFPRAIEAGWRVSANRTPTSISAA